ncbi:MAG: RDD family protein [Nitrospirota bacterium]
MNLAIWDNNFIGQRYKRAGFIRRCFAFIADCIILDILYLIFIVIGIFATNLALEKTRIYIPSEELVLSLSSLYFIFWFVLFLLYFTFFYSYGGQTPGKMLFRIKVVSSEEEEIHADISFLRSLSYFMSAIFFGGGFLIGLFNKNRKALHDIIADTLVVQIANRE